MTALTVIADVWIKRGNQHQRFVQKRIDTLSIGFDTDNAVLLKGNTGIAY